ncbi:MAG: phosphoribosylanthranilate isomerase [Acutalibacteraceae bacterium]
MVKVKICGLRRECDVDFVNEAKADFAGMIFASGRKRCITLLQAKKMKARLDKNIKAVGVFINEPIDYMKQLADERIIDIIQLHGTQDDEFVKQVQKQCGIPVIKAFRVQNLCDVEEAEKSSADFILFDSGAGGTGEKFDHSLLKNVKRPFFLAGGLDCESVESAVRDIVPFAVDTSSGTETNGYKDRDKILEFVQRARNI